MPGVVVAMAAALSAGWDGWTGWDGSAAAPGAPGCAAAVPLLAAGPPLAAAAGA